MKMRANNSNLLPPESGDHNGDIFDNESQSIDHDSAYGSPEDAEPKDEAIGKQETKDVVRLKLVAFLVLLGAAVIVAATVYLYLSATEHDQFIGEFEDDAQKVMDAIGSSLDKTLGSFDGLAVTLVSTAQMTNQTWPFVTLANFAVRMSKLLPFSDAINVCVAPIVKPHQKAEWEAYTVQHDGWVNESMNVQADWDRFFGPVVFNGDHNPMIHSDYEDLPSNISRIMLPSWQNFPVLANTSYTYNWDWLSSPFPEAYDLCISEHKAVISAPYMIPSPDDPQSVADTQLWAEFYRNFIGPEEEPMEPMSDFLYPLVDDVSRVVVAGDTDYQVDQHKAVGMLTASVYWRALIRNILPPGNHGLVLVFDNTCSPDVPFTYAIKGPKVQYMGVGDKHNKKYDDNAVSKKLSELSSSAMRDSAYSGALLDDTLCSFTLRAFPADNMRSAFITNDPLIFSAMVLFIFAFVSTVFWCYDQKVERRQTTVMHAAVRSSAIVSSLFPSEVRDRLYPEGDGSALLESSKNQGNPFASGRNREQFLNKTGMEAGSEEAKISPIASLYPETSVFFADISGFTAWSSERSPSQVFLLLETIYAAFDAIAKRRGVFKVETIGDCYVAVVGLPSPRQNHAVVMVRFAHDCRQAMSEQVLLLEETLGPGTANLAIRIGINSGPTTAGVLRGEKSRFQLFGDTVNTASRMESNGARNKIQVSQTTADLIQQAGKGHWLTERDEKIECKGKGTMTTYWCEPNSAAGTIVSSEYLENERTLLGNEATHRRGASAAPDRSGGNVGEYLEL